MHTYVYMYIGAVVADEESKRKRMGGKVEDTQTKRI